MSGQDLGFNLELSRRKLLAAAGKIGCVPGGFLGEQQPQRPQTSLDALGR